MRWPTLLSEIGYDLRTLYAGEQIDDEWLENVGELDKMRSLLMTHLGICIEVICQNEITSCAMHIMASVFKLTYLIRLEFRFRSK